MNTINKIHFLLLASIFLFSCTSTKVSEDTSVINATKMHELSKSKDLTLFVFYTSWCGATKHNYERFYQPLQKRIQDENLSIQIVMVAGDNKVTNKKLQEYQKQGFLSYRLAKGGSFAPANRYQIKKFLKKCYPKTNLEEVKGLGFGIPVEILVNKQSEVLNAEASAWYGELIENYISKQKENNK